MSDFVCGYSSTVTDTESHSRVLSFLLFVMKVSRVTIFGSISLIKLIDSRLTWKHYFLFHNNLVRIFQINEFDERNRPLVLFTELQFLCILFSCLRNANWSLALLR